MSNERQTIAAVIRGAAAVGGTVTSALGSLHPAIEPVSKVVQLLLGFVATLVENVGVNKAAELLEDLTKHPATPITDAELHTDVDSVKREFNVPTTKPPPNPFEGSGS